MHSGEQPVKIPVGDKSISIHSCHSPMREAQVLKDLLLELFLKDRTLKPHDIIVMMPDIESYAPYIESVFSLEHKIPFTISDRKRRSQSEIIETFLEILSLADSRVMLTQVMDILEKKPVGLKFDLSEKDVELIKEIAERTGICWGMDSYHKKHMGFPDVHENTWWFGFQRLMLGYAMPEHSDSLFNGVLPMDSFEGMEAEILGRFTFFCDTLFKSIKKLESYHNIEEWCDLFREILFLMMDMNQDANNDSEFIIGCLDELKLSAKQAGNHDNIGFDIAFSALNAKLDTMESSGNFFTGAVVFCNLMPMRSIPFKVVVIMGMNDKDFPGQTIGQSFDLIKKYPRLGDRIRRDELRYLFLEAILSARQNFIITYTGMSIKDNSVIPPAGVINELIDVIHESFVLPDPDYFIITHPLQPFSEKSFKENKHRVPTVSFSQHYFNIALNLNSKDFKDDISNPHSFNYDCLENSITDDMATLKDIISFFRMPVEYFVQKRLGIVFPNFPDFSDDREPVELDGLENYFIGQLILEKMIKYSCNYTDFYDQDIHNPCFSALNSGINNENGKCELQQDLYSIFKASGKLPHGRKGKIEFEAIKAEAESLFKLGIGDIIRPGTEPYSVHIDIQAGKIKVAGGIDNIIKITEQNEMFIFRYDYSFGKLSAKKILKAWVYHLGLNIYYRERYPVKTYLVFRGDKNGKPVKICFHPLKKAFKFFCTLIEFFEIGMKRPLLFFPETSWAFADTIYKSGRGIELKNMEKALNACKKKWNGYQYIKGEKTSPYLSLIFGDNDPFYIYVNSVEGGKNKGKNIDLNDEFAKNAMEIFSPLIDNMEIL